MVAGTLAVGVAVGLAGCDGGGRRGVAPPPKTTTTLGPKPTIRIGYLGDEAAGGTLVSRAVRQGELLAVQQFASGGGNVDVVMKSASTGGTESGAAAAARTLVADHVVAVVGPQSYKELRGAEPVLARAGIPELTATLTAPTLPSGWADVIRVVADDAQQGSLEADELVRKLRCKQVAVVRGEGPGDRPRVAAAATEVTADGATVVADLTVGSSGRAATRTAATAAGQVVGSGADGVLVSAPAAASRAVVAALSEAGYKGRILVATGVSVTPYVLDPLGPAADGALVASPASDNLGQATAGGPALDFRDTFRAAFGQVPPRWSAEAYDATDWVLAAVRGGATTPGMVRSHLAAHAWTGVTSTLSLGAGGVQADPPMWFSQVRDGAPVQLSELR
ncbi:MAG TPA: ABC transporter substrate-binding protein [Acidimicrobiales bacterium]|nr:ABC transporter substrate-binding protein [Acidimicrobiales bacterium]